jgi:hypothetical protein
MIWIEDLVLWQACYELDLIQENSKIKDFILKISKSFFFNVFFEMEFKFKIGPKLLFYLKPTPFHFSLQFDS